MNSGSAAKIRFVRCPKCRQVLVEPQDIPVYKCGGCGTHLQVKIRKSNPEVATSGLHETDAAQKSRSDHISEAKESSSSNHEENFLSPGECSSDQLNGGDCAASGDCDLDHLSGANLPEELQRSGSDQNGSGDFDSKQPGGVNSSHNQKNEIDKNDPGDSDNEHVVGVGSSNEHQQNGSGQNATEDCVDLKVIGTSLSSDDQERGNDSNESPQCNHEQPEIFNEVQIQQLESGDCNDEQLGGMGGISTEAQNDWSDRNDSSDCNVEQAGFSYRVCSPTKLDEELSPLAGAKPKAEVNEGGIQQNESGAFSDEQLGSVNLSTEAEDVRSDQSDSLDFSIEQAGISYEVCSPTRRAHLKNKESSPLAGAKSEVEVSDESSPLTVTKAELDAHSDSDGTSNDVCSPTRRAHLKNKEPSPLAGEKKEFEASDESSPLTVTKAELDTHSDSDGTSNDVCSPTRRAHLKNKEPSPLAGEKKEFEASNESSPLTVTKAELDAHSDSDGTSNNVCSPTKRAHLKNKEPSPLAGAKKEVEVSDESSPPLTVTKAELDAHSDSDGTSNDVCSLTKHAHLKNKEPSPLAGAKSEVEVSDESSQLAATKAELDAHSDSDGTSNDDCSLTKLSLLENKELSSVEGEKSEAGASNESSQLAGAKALLDASKESGSDFIKSSIEKSVDKEGASVVAAQRPAGESISSDIFVTSPNEQPEKLHETGRHGFDHVQCTDTFKTMDLIDPSSELSDSLIDLSKSPTTRSSRAYYDDTVSSYEGTDDQLPDRPKHPFRNAHKQANHAASNERPRSEKFVANSSLEMQHHLKNHTSIISDNSHRALKSSKLNRDELVEHTRVAHPARNWRRLEKDEYPSQAPFYQRDILAGYDNGSPSNQNNNESRSNPYFHSREKAAYTEQEKMKLLEMIYELQDQVNVLNGKEKGRVAPGVTWKDHNPSYNDHLEQVIFDDLDYPRYPGRFRGGSNWHPQSKYSQVPFSAEVASNRNQVDHLCCCPQDWRLAQLPPPNLHHNRVFCKAQDRVEFYHSYGSCPSTPQRHADSEFSIYRRETLSDDHRRRDQEVKKYVTKKHHLAKRHLLPLAGGAPFITCFFCFKQLQLPADFLLSKRKYHQLRCGVCLEVLRFSLISRTHLVPYTPTADAPPPSEVDEHSGGLHRRISASSSHASNCPNMDPVSCSEDYGLPFCKSGSTDGDPVQTSLRSAESSLNERRKNPKEKHELSGPSSSMSKTKKVSSEIEELPRKGGGGSPLHRLMGYSSPSRLIYGYEPSCSSWYYPAED
ncbi:hypothetical protein H0E87_030707 [Populus deltoides]|uniref:Zinc-ribbon domain-containing protein n=1 Tax=Populus deltoides TaxID=3696 RepID=A0A8T2WIZ9_POPDE|nr:hypothetical protein H0E87_030707 [Populus deltoides]